MFCTKDKQELLALHRIIVEAKYSDNIVDSAIISSSLVAEIANRVISSALEEMNKEEAESWIQWLQVEPDSRQYKTLINHIKAFDNWRDVVDEDKPELIQTLAAPLKLNEILIEELVKFGDRHWKT